MRAMGCDHHPRCSELQISHISFADDLFVMAAATQKSLQVVKRTVEKFHQMPGLKPGYEKSKIFTLGVSIEEAKEMAVYMGIPLGSLPVKYLAVPLISTRLTSLDCQHILDKMLRRIQSWANKVLSYGRRVILVKSIRNSMFVYWGSMFILPKKFVKKVEQTLSPLLWAGPELKHNHAKIRWKDRYVQANERRWTGVNKSENMEQGIDYEAYMGHIPQKRMLYG